MKILGLVFFTMLINFFENFGQTKISIYGNIDKYINSSEYIPIDFDCIYFNNNKIEFEYNEKKKQTFILKNDILIDSIMGFIGNSSYYNNKDTSLFLVSNSTSIRNAINIYQFFFNKNKSRLIKKDYWGMVMGIYDGKLLTTNKVIFVDTIVDELVYIDQNTSKIEKFLKLSNDITKYSGDYYSNYYQIKYVFTFPNSKNIILVTCEVDNSEAEDQGVYLNYIYNAKDNKIIPLKMFQNLPFEIQSFDDNSNYSIILNFIFNKEFDFIENGIFPRYSNNLNYQIFNNKVVTYMNEIHYKNKYMHLPYRFVYKLSTNMYRILNDSFVNEIDLQEMDQTDLKVLRSMIFAKYGYIFDSQYLNLYFKMYSFYKPITTDYIAIERSYTDIDKTNLIIINKYIVEPNLFEYKPIMIENANRIIGYIDTMAIYIMNGENDNYEASFQKFKLFLNGNKEVSEDIDLLKQIYLKNGLEIFSSDVGTQYSVIHYQVRNTINSLSAIYGYDFENEKWNRIYKLFDWYRPITKSPDFPPSIKNLTENLLKYENEFKE
jgi:hypothetical protein